MFLKDLTELDGVSGNEDKVRDYIVNNIRKFSDEILMDPMGNLIVKRFGKGKKILFAAHMDEVGLMITGINDDGTLSFTRAGGIMPEVIVGKYFRKDDVIGVVGIKPIHLRKDRTKVPDVDSMVLDIGAKDKKEAEGKVKIGDYFTFDTNFKWINKYRFITKAVDDRAGCAAILDIFKDKEFYNKNIIGLFTVQEETGTRGARGVIDYIDVDRAYVVEGTGCGDFPNPERERDLPLYPRLLNGPVITIMDASFLIDKHHLDNIERVANKYKIPYQYKRPGIGGTDTRHIEKSKNGILSAVISMPARYIHSPHQIGDIRDYNNTVKLLKAILKEDI